MSAAYTLPPGLEEADLRETTYHEAGHKVVANHYDLDASFTVERVGDPTIYDRAWVGQSRYLVFKATPFQNAVVGWAGAMAEELKDEPPDKWADAIKEVAAQLLEDYYDGEPNLSPTDRAGIDGTPQFTRAFNRACALVVLHAAEIAAEAEKMIARHKGVR
jgi:hypothetical protein